MEKEIEILAPANMQTFKTALYSGANAIYLGLNNFNARAKAENFNIENIREAVKLAHLFNVKIYLTINTLISDNELDSFLKMVEIAYLAKVDAFIVQDLGVAKILKERFKNIVLHASTQMGINNLYGAIQLEKLGFKRIVLSRETSLEDIMQIKKNTNLEIEFFVQGALCVAFSGNCYFSSLKHNQSGNRGKCLQLCRLRYNAIYNNVKLGNGYYLSPKDLCLLENVKALLEAGVDSFKIEGRLRRASYINQSVKSLKEVVNNLNELNYNFSSEYNKLKKFYVRGYDYNNNAYLDKSNDGIIDKKFNNHTGIEIGIVKSVKPFKVGLYEIIIESGHILKQGDGLKFFYKELEPISLGVGNVDKLGKNLYRIYSKNKPNNLSTVHLIVDIDEENKALELAQKLPVSFDIKFAVGENCIAYAIFEDISVKIKSDWICEQAFNSNAKITENALKEQFSKLNNSNFYIKDSSFDIQGEIFVSKSQLNDLRRNLIAKLEERILEKKEKSFDLEVLKVGKVNEPNNINLKNNFNVYIVDEFIVLNKKPLLSDFIIVSPKNYKKLNNNIFADLGNNYNCEVGLHIPAFANSDDIEILDSIIEANPNIPLLIDNIFGFKYQNGKRKIICNYPMNVYNSQTASVLAGMGAYACVKSVEHIDGGIKSNKLLNYSGKVNLMTFVHCPYKAVFENTCSNCKANKKMEYELNGNKYEIYKYVISKCYFYLRDNIPVNKSEKFGLHDLT